MKKSSVIRVADKHVLNDYFGASRRAHNIFKQLGSKPRFLMLCAISYATPAPPEMGMPPPPLGAAPAHLDAIDMGIESTGPAPTAPVPAGERVDTMSGDEKDKLLSALGD